MPVPRKRSSESPEGSQQVDTRRLPKISVIVCTYNYAHLLPDALRTLAAQTSSDFELLIVDDGSTDNTEEVVQRFLPQFQEGRYLPKPHTGIADSRNFGIQEATGSYIALLDADDLWAPRYIEEMRAVLETTPQAEMVSSDGLNVSETGEIRGPLFPPGLPSVCGPLRTSRQFLAFFPYINVSATIFTKSLSQRTGPFDTRYRSGDDMDWYSRAVQKEAFCVRLDRRLVFTRTHELNLTSHADQIMETWLSVYKEIWKGKVADPAIQEYLRKATRLPFLTLLARFPAGRNRALLRRAIESLDGDWLLGAAHSLTYLGLCRFARWARRVKHMLLQFSPPVEKVNLQAPPEIMFAPVSQWQPQSKVIPAGRAG
ncbi:MAG: glycosyltransferase [Acidobacteria bacterium]|nr:glycosyltransferase [Acidobacteriota bacterium]